MKVIFSPESEDDLDDIAATIALHAPTRAFTFVQELIEAAEGTGHFPEGYVVAFRGRRDYRVVVRGAYLIFYSIEADHIRVARIIHGARLLHSEMFS